MKAHSASINFQIIFMMLACFSFSGALSIPENEEEAMHMIRTGELDSNIWNMIEPYYSQPISVPGGELDILMKIFPELSGDLPVSDQQLAQFFPWTKQNVEKFFSAWPELRTFKPLLDFSSTGPSTFGKVGIFLNKSYTQSHTTQHIQFTLSPVRPLHVQGRIHVAQQYARWNSRVFTISPVAWWSLHAGDVQPLQDDGLVMGFFQKNENSDSSLLSNWLYGDARGWNSIVLHIGPFTEKYGIVLQPFMHKRVSESSAGVVGALDVSDKFKNDISVFTLDATEQQDMIIYFLYRAQLRMKSGSVQVVTCSPLGVQPVMPVSIKSRFKNDKDEMNADVVFIPTGFKGTRSLLISTIGNAEMTRNTIREDLLYARCMFRHNFSAFSLLPVFTMKYFDYSLESISAGVLVSGDMDPVQYQVQYNWLGSEHDHKISTQHEYAINFSMSTQKWFETGLEINCRVYESNTAKIHVVVSSGFVLNSGLTISPFLKFNKDRSNSETFSLGFTQRLVLFESTYSNVSIEREIINSQRGSFRVNAKMWYLF